MVDEKSFSVENSASPLLDLVMLEPELTRLEGSVENGRDGLAAVPSNDLWSHDVVPDFLAELDGQIREEMKMVQDLGSLLAVLALSSQSLLGLSINVNTGS